MGIINFMKGVYRRMFPLKDIASAIGRTPIMTDEMQRKVEVWRKSYFGKADWVDGDKVISLRIESSAVREQKMSPHHSDRAHRRGKESPRDREGGRHRRLHRRPE